MSDQQVAKLRAHASRVLDLFRTLRDRFALLKPLAFDADLASRVGDGPRAYAHMVLKDALLESCVQNIAKISSDSDGRTPSLTNIMDALDWATVQAKLRTDYAVPPISTLVTGDSLPAELEAELRQKEADRLAAEFDNAFAQLREDWQRVQADGRIAAFKTWRDKVIAHSELRHADGAYAPVDLATLGLTWGDLEPVIGELQEVVAGVGIVVRGASFAWGMLDEQLNEASTAYWAAFAGTRAT